MWIECDTQSNGSWRGGEECRCFPDSDPRTVRGQAGHTRPAGDRSTRGFGLDRGEIRFLGTPETRCPVLLRLHPELVMQSPGSSRQKMNFSPNWMFRGPPAPVIRPRFRLPTSAFGLPN